MKKVFFTTWIITLLACLMMFVGVNIRPIGRTLTVERSQNGMRTGGLYYDCKVDYFKEHYKSIGYKETTSVQEADIIAFGDSFLNSGLGDLYFADILEQETGKKVHLVDTRDHDPLQYLADNNVQKGKEKILILESVEYESINHSTEGPKKTILGFGSNE